MPVSRPIRGFCFGPFELDSDTGELRNNGTPLHLQPQPLQVLTILLQSPGKLVTREQLQQQLWPQDTFVEFEVGLNQAIKKLRETLGDSAQSPIYIETVPRRGYRFIAPVQEILPAEFPAEQTTDRTNISTPQADTWILILYKKSSIIIIATMAFIVAVTGDLAYRHYRRTQFAGQPIAVTSFRDLTQDPQLGWLATGMSEMLTTNLGQVQGIDLISPERLVRAESEFKKGKAPTPAEVAREAGAKLFVTGSVMKVSPSKVVVEVRLQEVDHGKIIFSETMEGENVASIFQMTNATTERLSKELLPRNAVPEQSLQIEQSLTSNIEALRHYQAAASYGRRMLNDKAIRELEEAVHLDPRFAAAYLALFRRYRSVGDAGKALEQLRSAERFQDRLPQLAKLEIEASKVTLSGDIRELIRVREEMLRRDPRNVENRNELALAYITDRQPQRAVRIMQDAISRDPRDSFLVSQHPYDFGWAGDEAGAIEACRKYAALVGSDEPDPWSAFGDMYYLFGRSKEAANAYRELLAVDPSYSRYDAFKSLAIIYADGGERQLAERMLQEYRKRVSGVWQIDAAAFEAQLHQLRGDPEGSLTIYQRLVPALIDIRQEQMAEATLRVYASTALLLGRTNEAAKFVRQQNLRGRELLILSWLMASSGDSEGSERTLSEYRKRVSEPEYLGAQREQSLNSLRIALARNDRAAAMEALKHLPVPLLTPGEFGRRSELLVSGQAHLLVRDYAASESDFKLLATTQRMLSAYRQGRSQSPLLEHLSHFYLGQVYEATGRRPEGLREYKSFLARYSDSTSHLRQIGEARSAVKRLGEN